MVIKRTENGLVATEPFLATCGCGSVVPDARHKLRLAGVPDVPMLVTSGNDNVRYYLTQVGISALVPSINRNRHAVIYNPNTGRYIDILDTPNTPDILDNIKKVVLGD